MKYYILIIQIAVLVGVTLLITKTTGNETRVGCGFFFGMCSLPILMFSKALSRFMHSKQLGFIKKSTTVDTFEKGLKHGGVLLLSSGLALVFVGLMFTYKFYSISNNLNGR